MKPLGELFTIIALLCAAGALMPGFVIETRIIFGVLAIASAAASLWAIRKDR